MLVYIVSIISPYCVLMYNANKPVDLVAVSKLIFSEDVEVPTVIPNLTYLMITSRVLLSLVLIVITNEKQVLRINFFF